MTLNSHKIYGPKGVGCLYVRKGTIIDSLFHGGGQEYGMRSTTENLAENAGFAEAAELCINEMSAEAERLKTLQNFIINELQARFDGFYLNGSMEHRLANNINFGISGLRRRNNAFVAFA